MKSPSQRSWQARRGKDLPRAEWLSKQEIFSSLNSFNMVRTRAPINENGPTSCCRPAFAWRCLLPGFPFSALYAPQQFGGYTAGSLERIHNTCNMEKHAGYYAF